MTTYETNIGVLTRDQGAFIVTVGELKQEIDNGCYYSPRQYCDARYGSNLQRFKFDPYTGEKINWKEVKNFLERK